MKILNITIQSKNSILDNTWLGGEIPTQKNNSMELSDNFFSIAFNNTDYHVFYDGKSNLIKENHSISLKEYRVNFAYKEKNNSMRDSTSFVSSLGNDTFHSSRNFFSSQKEESDPDERLNFLYSGLSSTHRENFLIHESPSLPYASFQNERDLRISNRIIPKKNEKLFYLSAQMIQNALSVFKKEKE